MTTWDQVHAGDIVLGHDGNAWGVASVAPHPAGPVVEIVRHGETLRAQPPVGTPITVIEAADVATEAQVFGMFERAGLGPEILWESYQP